MPAFTTLVAIAMQTLASGMPEEMMASGLMPEYMNSTKIHVLTQMQNSFDPQSPSETKNSSRPMLVATRVITGIAMVGFPIAAYAVESAYQKEFRDYKKKNGGSSVGYPSERRESLRMIETIYVCVGIANAAIFVISFAI